MSALKMSRRNLLLGSAAAAGALSLRSWGQATPPDRRYLFIIGATGGASILDSFLPVRESASANGSTLTTFADSLVTRPTGSNLDCVSLLSSELTAASFKADFAQAGFLDQHKDDVAVMTLESASVNHIVAQQRALTGGGINSGRTLLEAVGLKHGVGLPLPVVNMMTGGFSQPGRDRSIPNEGRQVAVQDPRTFAFGTHGHKGLARPVDAGLLARARTARDSLETKSAFGQTFGAATDRSRYLELRTRALGVETADLITRLMLRADGSLGMVGLSSSPDLPTLRTFFPNLALDTFEAQAALAFLLVKYGVSVAVGMSVDNAIKTMSDGGTQKVVNAQLAFDYSHSNHRVTQSAMWSRILRVTDGLIRLLKTTEDTAHAGESLWARSLIYVATDFGREKQRPAAGATTFGTGHHLNNGVVLISPRLKGNRVYGGVDPDTCLTYGFDRVTGNPAPGTVMGEADVYSAICGALGVDFSGRVSLPAMLKG
jgi:hypothetical protein